MPLTARMQPALLTSPATPEYQAPKRTRSPVTTETTLTPSRRGKEVKSRPSQFRFRFRDPACCRKVARCGRALGEGSVVPGSPAVAAAAMAASTAAGKQRIPKVAKVSGSGPCGRRPGMGLARPWWCLGREACGPGSWSSLPERGPRAGRASRGWGSPPRPRGRRVRRCLSGGGERFFSTDTLKQTLASRWGSG